jgi:sugar (pentulose or hexulose) kinase
MLYVGIDMGTSYTKAILLGNELELLEKASLPADCGSDAEQWYRHFTEVIEYFCARGFVSDKLICSIAAQGGTFVLLDSGFTAVSRACSWTQKSSETVADEMVKAFGRIGYYRETGCVPSQWMMACKLREMVADPNNNLHRAKYVSTVPEFVHARLGGRFFTDITSAQITGMCDFRMGRWSRSICDWAGVGEKEFASIQEKSEIIIEDAKSSGRSLNITTSSHDQYAAMRAVGMGENDLMLGTGTAWVINGKSKQPILDEVDCQIFPGRDIGSGYGYIVGLGAIGKEFAELLVTLNINKGTLSEMEKTFWHNSPQTTEAAMVKQFMDSAVAKVGSAIEKLKRKGVVPQKLIMTGGATTSSYLPAAITAVCQLPVEVVKFRELTAYGAALFAAQAVGVGGGATGLPEDISMDIVEPEQV